jgi:CheY-like chemotaxis protein
MTAPDGPCPPTIGFSDGEMVQPTVLIVGKFRDDRELVRDVLSAAGYGCLVAGETYEALKLFRELRPALVLSDLGRPGMTVDGVELLKQIRREDTEIPIVFLTGGLDDEAEAECLRLGALAVLHRPMDIDRLLTAAARALKRNGH